MSLYDDASLVMIPSGYKDGKLYSVKPSDGAGDFTFTRGSNLAATRVDEDGLIEKGRENLLLQSNQFDNPYWSKLNVTIAANQTAAPDGTTTADKITGDGTSTLVILRRLGFTLTANAYTLSFFAKADTYDIVSAGVVGYTSATGSTRVYADLTNGTASGGTITSVGSGWYRISTTFTPDSGDLVGDIQFTLAKDLSNVAFDTNADTNGKSAFVWGAQLEVGLVATDYIETGATTAQAGILEDMPRLDYSGGASCPSLLLEPQRTNLVTQSEYFADAGWAKSLCTITSNQIVSPSGYLDADLVTTSGTADALQQSISATSGITYTFSGFIKSGSANEIFLVAFGSIPTSVGSYNLTNGTATSGTGSPIISIQDYGNGWYRATLTATATSTGTASFYFASGSLNAVSTYYAWGAQIEEGSYPTSYIPTYGTSVTRGADICNNLGTLGIIGQTEGTILFDAFFEENDKVNFSLSDSTSSNHLTIDTTGTNSVFGRIVASGTTQAEINTSGGFFANGDRLKCALAYKANDFAFYINGAQIGTDTSGSVPVCDDIRFARYNGSLAAYQNVNQVLLFDTRLTNSELAALTTP